MFKPLDRPIAIVCADEAFGAFLTRLIQESSAQSEVFAAADFNSIDVDKFEGLLLAEVEVDGGSLLRKFHARSKPIAAIGKSVVLVARTFAAEAIEVTTGEDPMLGAQITSDGALHTLCPASDYVSDRDNKTLTTPGSLHARSRESSTLRDMNEGIRKMLRELVEMA